MTTAGKAYVVRDAGVGTGPGEVTQVYAYTLQGLTTALEDARLRSHNGTPQVANGKSRVIRRFEDGHQVSLPSLVWHTAIFTDEMAEDPPDISDFENHFIGKVCLWGACCQCSFGPMRLARPACGSAAEA